jgi:hypothetical protein
MSACRTAFLSCAQGSLFSRPNSKRLHDRGRLQISDSLAPLADQSVFEKWLLPVRAKDWVVHCQSAPPDCQGPGAAMKYLARYVVGTAISDARLLSDDGQSVTFRAKDYRHQGRSMELVVSGAEFVRRFLWHVLPPRMIRVLYYGLFANNHRAVNLERCRELLDVPAEASDTGSDTNAQHAEAQEEGRGPDQKKLDCPKCGAPGMVWIGELAASTGWHRWQSMVPNRSPSTVPNRSRAGELTASRPPP